MKQKKGGIVATSNDDVFYTDNIEEVVADRMSETNDNSDNSSRGKSTAGSSLSYLFKPFSASDSNTAGYAEIPDYDSDDSLSSGLKSLLKTYYGKFRRGLSILVSDANLIKAEDREKNNGFVKTVSPGEHDKDSIRGICHDAPMFMAGFGISSSGAYTADKVGPLDTVWNDNIKMWTARQRFPVPARVTDISQSNPYTVQVAGIQKNTEGEGFVEGSGFIPGETTISDTFSDVYHLGDPIGSGTLDINDIVNLYYDWANNKYSCVSGSAGTPSDGSFLVKAKSDASGGKIDVVYITSDGTEVGDTFEVNTIP